MTFFLKLIHPVYNYEMLTDHMASLHMTCFGWVVYRAVRNQDQRLCTKHF